MISPKLENEFLKNCGLLNSKYVLYFNMDNKNNELILKEKKFVKLISENFKNDISIVKAISKNEKKDFFVINIRYDDISEDILIKNAYIIVFFGFNYNILNKLEKCYIYKMATVIYSENLEMFNEYAIATNNIESIVTFIKNNWDEPHKLKKYVEDHHSELDNFARSIKITNKLKNKTKKNIKLNYKKKHTNAHKEDFINILTFYYEIDNKQRQSDILKCVKINVENPNVKRYYLFIEDGKEEKLDNIYKENKKIELVKCSPDKNFKELFSYANKELVNEIICILRPDIFLPNNDSLDTLMSYLINNRRFFSLSRLEKSVTGQIWKDPALMESYYCNSQDAWLYKSPIDINVDLDFNQKKSNAKLNKCILDAGYYPINDTENFKVVGLNSLLIPDSFRQNNNDKMEKDEDVYYLPETMGVNSMSIDTLINNINLTNEKKYLLKCDIFNKLIQLKKNDK